MYKYDRPCILVLKSFTLVILINQTDKQKRPDSDEHIKIDVYLILIRSFATSITT